MAYDPADPYRPLFRPPSLAEQKAVSLAGKYAEKKEAIAPSPVLPAAPVAPTGPDMSHLNFENEGDNTGLIDIAQASMLRAGGNISDFGRATSNSLFNTNFDDSREAGWSNPETADSLAGVSQQYRQQMQQDQNKVLQSVADENYGEALWNAVKVSGRTAADSFATIPEVAAGAAITAFTGGVGLPLLADKARRIFNVGEDVVEAYDDIKKAKVATDKIKEANRIGRAIKGMKKLPATTAKAAGQASILTADLVQQQTADYVEKYGEEPSIERKAMMGLGVLATTIWQPAIMAKLFIPDFKKQLMKEAVTLKSNVVKGSNLVNIAKRVGDATNKLVKAGAAESAQEYLQTWQEILAVDITPEESENLMKAIASKLDDKKYQDMALTGGILGGTSAGAIRGTISAPAVATGTAVDLTKATAKGTAKTAKGAYNVASKGAQYVQNKARMDVLSETEKESIKNDYEIRKAQTDEMSSTLDRKIENISKAQSYEDMVADESNADFINQKQEELNLTDEDLKNPKNLQRLKDAIIRKHKADKGILKVELETSNVATMASQLGKAAVRKTTETADAIIKAVPEEVVTKTIEAYLGTKKKAQEAIDSLKELKSSTALGVIEVGLKGTGEETKNALRAARKLEMSDLRRVQKIISQKNPGFGKDLERLYQTKLKALKDTGQQTDTLVNEETLSPIIKDVAAKGEIKGQSLPAVAQAIKQTMAGKVEDIKSLNAIKKALGIYKESDAYKNADTPGRINEKNMTILENKIRNAERRLNREVTGENIKRTAKTAVNAGSKVVDKVKKEYPDVANKTREKVSKWTDSAVKAADSLAQSVNEKITRWVDGKKVMPEGDTRNKILAVSNEVAKGEESAAVFTNKINSIVKALNTAGYYTEQDLTDLVEQFPGLAKDKDFYRKLSAQFATDVVMDENTDQVESTNEKPNKAFEFFKSLGLTECK